MQNHITMRNDLVHRNGKDKNGHPVDVSIDLIRKELIQDVRTFADSLDDELKRML